MLMEPPGALALVLPNGGMRFASCYLSPSGRLLGQLDGRFETANGGSLCQYANEPPITSERARARPDRCTTGRAAPARHKVCW